jgi:CDP-diacylglycerol--glycerol-3-phosphate 3-phosphatidyltransferase
MKKHIPMSLIWARLLIGIVIVILSYHRVRNYQAVAIILLTIGLLTDVFDGIIARRLQVSTQKLRRLDSTVDQLFFSAVAVATYIQCPDFFKTHALKLGVLLGLEALTYVVSFLKFKKEIATHSIGAKIWTLSIFATLIQVMVQCRAPVWFEVCFWTGLLTRLEIIAIILTLKKWTNDVPTFYHAWKLRHNQEIKRHKLFNG